MNEIKVFENTHALAHATATLTIEIMKGAIAEYDSATWVLAGGDTPLESYRVIASEYENALDWTRVTVLIGDERIGPLDGPDNNWHKIEEVIGSLPVKKIRPNSDQPPEDVVAAYEQDILRLPKSDNGLPRFDVVWLGIGSDGHTLSLFPEHSSLLPNSGLVTAIYDSPKPPAARISLTLRAMQGAKNIIVLAAGEDKKEAVVSALRGNHSPIAIIASIVHTHEGQTTWMLDKTAAPTD